MADLKINALAAQAANLDLDKALLLYPAQALNDTEAGAEPPVKTPARALFDPGAVDIGGGAIDGTEIGQDTPAPGAFTTADIDGGAIDGTEIGQETPAPGAFTTADIDGGTIDGTEIGQETPAPAAFTLVTVGGEALLTGAPARQVLPADVTTTLALTGNATGSRDVTLPAAWRDYLASAPAAAVHLSAAAVFTAHRRPKRTRGKLKLMLGTTVLASARADLDSGAPVTLRAEASIADLGGEDHVRLRMTSRAPDGGAITVDGFSLAAAPVIRAGPARLPRIAGDALAAGDLVTVHDTASGELRGVTLKQLAGALARLK